MKVAIVNDHEIALKYVSEGYQPIECSFGANTAHSRSHPDLNLDHHGQFDDLDCPTRRAQTEEFFNKGWHKYVLSHVDLDSVATILGLEGMLIDPDIVDRIVRNDVLGPHACPKEERYHPNEVKVHMMSEVVRQNHNDIENCIKGIVNILYMHGYDSSISDFVEKDKERRKTAFCHPDRYDLDDVVLVQDNEFVIDIFYDTHQFVVQFIPERGAITIGCIDEKTAKKRLGEDGLRNLYHQMGDGWGGRIAVGGSPRGKKMTFDDAFEVASLLSEMIKYPSEYEVVRETEIRFGTISPGLGQIEIFVPAWDAAIYPIPFSLSDLPEEIREKAINKKDFLCHADVNIGATATDQICIRNIREA